MNRKVDNNDIEKIKLIVSEYISRENVNIVSTELFNLFLVFNSNDLQNALHHLKGSRIGQI